MNQWYSEEITGLEEEQQHSENKSVFLKDLFFVLTKSHETNSQSALTITAMLSRFRPTVSFHFS